MADWTDLQSTNLQRYKYDPATKQLTITFNSGGTYVYDDVDPVVVESFVDAPSAGQFFAKHIKPRHTGNRVG